ncbi:MAG: DinB family protein [Phycisphaeraceae bacterium]
MQNDSELSSIKEMALDRLTWSRGLASALFAGVPDDQLTAKAGGKGNHPLWVMGHIAVSEDGLVSAYTGQKLLLSDRMHALFKGGTEPTDNAADYPSRAEVIQALETARKKVLDWLQSMDEKSMHQPAPKGLERLAPDAISTAFTLAMHELFHAGQMASVRSALSLPRVFR